MRFWKALALGIALPFVTAQPQSPFETKSITLVDALSQGNYTSLLHLLQRARLIPTLNRLNGSTLFAPTNEAIERHALTNALWSTTDEAPLVDNVQEQLRQQLFYHLLNYSIAALPDDKEVQVLQTLHFPRTPVDPPSHEPPPYPPWMPIPGGTLGGAPQRLRITDREQKAFVGVDGLGNGGIEVVKGEVNAGNGVLLGIENVLEPPPNLAQVVSQQTSLAYFNRVVTPEIIHLLNSTPELTLFLPSDNAWDSLNPYERLYLESQFATDDLLRILDMHAVVEKKVRWSDSFTPAANLTTMDGRQLEVVVTPEKTMVSSATLLQSDIYASNGVLHVISDLLVPLNLTPEKFLLGLNCSSFVNLLHSVNLTHLVNDTDTKHTILAPTDDALIFGPDDLPAPGSADLQKILKYHFIPGRWLPNKLKDGQLLETELDEEGLDGGRQVLDVEVATDLVGDKKKPSSPSIRFGGASIVGDPIEVNNTIIYFISKTLTPPSNTLDTALPNLDLSSFLAAIFSTSVADTLKAVPRTTFLVPHNSAFQRLGLLVSNHLLAATSKADLEKVILHHVIDSVEYTQSLQNGSTRTFATLEGSDLHFDRDSGPEIQVTGSGGWAGMKSAFYPTNTLTQTGVIHELSDIVIPRSVDLTVGKLMKAAKGDTMTRMVAKAGMDWILNGTAPPEDSPWANEGLEGAGWVLLCPTDDALAKLNTTELYEQPDQLRALVGQHLIPVPSNSASSMVDEDVFNNNRPLLMNDSTTYTTLHSSESVYGDVVFRQTVQEDGSTQLIVGISNARGTNGSRHSANVLAWGRSTTGTGTGGVVQIDAMLSLYEAPWMIQYGAPVLSGLLIFIGILAFFYAANVFWHRDTTEATYEPLGGFAAEDNEE